ncbi:MAG TPA: permease [Leucothrix sp.]|nr:permease [Leucothrix sp.]
MIEFLNNFLALCLEAAPWLVLGLVIGGLMKALIPTALMQKHLSGNGFSSIIKAALFGAPLPLCSCGVIPAALGLRRAGASKPATVSFLVSTPETGIDSVSISYALLGPFMAVVRPVAAIASAVVAGLLVGRSEETEADFAKTSVATSSCCSSESGIIEKSSCCDSEKSKKIEAACCSSAESIEEANVKTVSSCCSSEPVKQQSSCCSSESVKEESSSCCSSSSSSSKNKEAKPVSLLQSSWDGIVYSFTDLFDKVLFWLVIGLMFAALVKTFVPVSFLAEWGSGLPAMLMMLVVGIPMYVCATASTPIAAGLLLAGISPGVAMVYLMAGPATNISTLGVIGKELGRRSLIAYLTGVVVVALLTGFIVDYLVERWNVDIQAQISHSHDMVPAIIAWGSLLILIAVVIKLKLPKYFK